jgi:hypothetical protein
MKTTKSTLTLVLCAFLMLTSTACSKSNEEKKEAAIAKIEKALNDKKFEKATEALNQIPSEFEADIEVYHCKIKASEIKNNFDNVWTRYGKELAFRNKIAEMYPYVGVEYLLSELLKLECFHCDEDGDDYESHYQFHEYVDNYFQSDYDNYRVQPYNYCAEGWNHALQSIAILAAKNGKAISAGYSKVNALENKGETDYLAMVVYMPTTVGNKTNHDGINVPSINLGINLVATQFSYEEDKIHFDTDNFYSLLRQNEKINLSIPQNNIKFDNMIKKVSQNKSNEYNNILVPQLPKWSEIKEYL